MRRAIPGSQNLVVYVSACSPDCTDTHGGAVGKSAPPRSGGGRRAIARGSMIVSLGSSHPSPRRHDTDPHASGADNDPRSTIPRNRSMSVPRIAGSDGWRSRAHDTSGENDMRGRSRASGTAASERHAQPKVWTRHVNRPAVISRGAKGIGSHGRNHALSIRVPGDRRSPSQSTG